MKNDSKYPKYDFLTCISQIRIQNPEKIDIVCVFKMNVKLEEHFRMAYLLSL